MADEEKERQAMDGAAGEQASEESGARKARSPKREGARRTGAGEEGASPKASAKAERPERGAGRTRPARKAEPPGPQDDAPELPPAVAQALERIQARFPEVKARGRRDLWLEVQVDPSRLVDVATFLRDDPALRFGYLALLTGVDRLDEGFEVVTHLTSLEAGLRLILRTRVPREEPTCPSLTGVWAGANWHEREAYDLVGIRFEGHPDLRRILLQEGWEGHPLRKDYVDRRPTRRIQVKADWARKA